MNKLKTLTLFGAAAMALLALAGTASATTLTTPEGTTPTIKSESEGHISLHNPIAKIECRGSIEGKVESHGAGVAASGNVLSTAFTGCTNNWHVTVVAPGSVSFTANKEGGSNVKSSGLTLEATRFGIFCRYATSNTTVGTATEGTPPTTDLLLALPFHNGSGLCGAGATTVTGSYKITSPSSITVDP